MIEHNVYSLFFCCAGEGLGRGRSVHLQALFLHAFACSVYQRSHDPRVGYEPDTTPEWCARVV